MLSVSDNVGNALNKLKAEVCKTVYFCINLRSISKWFSYMSQRMRTMKRVKRCNGYEVVIVKARANAKLLYVDVDDKDLTSLQKNHLAILVPHLL